MTTVSERTRTMREWGVGDWCTFSLLVPRILFLVELSSSFLLSSAFGPLCPFRDKWVLLDGDKIAALCAAFIHEELAKLGLDKVRRFVPLFFRVDGSSYTPNEMWRENVGGVCIPHRCARTGVGTR